MKFLYLHGLGQKPDSWDRVIKETKVSGSSASLSLAEMLEGKAATYRELYTAFSEECDKENDEIVLCGLSLGAVLALNYAIDHPNKVKALVLIAAQYKMPVSGFASPVVSVRRFTVRQRCAVCHVLGSTMASWVFSKISQSDGSFFTRLSR